MMAAGARLAAKGAGKKDGDIKILGTDGLPGPAGGIRAVAEGEWAATFTYPTGGPRRSTWRRRSCSIAPRACRRPSPCRRRAITPDNAKSMMGK